MKNMLLKLYISAQIMRDALKNEEGQDLIEYALVVALIALGATAGMTGLAGKINNAFANIGTQLTSEVG
ncbi:MAG: Flp family type IVb pilin [Acidobacteriaceae bacterium]|nr:Flp family type IVb pilin [Acidobacteriaceae bacterium]